MDAKEKKDRADQTACRVYDILKNHDQEMSTMKAQIVAEARRPGRRPGSNQGQSLPARRPI